MSLVDDDWKVNKHGQHTLEKGRFIGYVEDDGAWWVHYQHSDGNPRLVHKGRHYLSVMHAQLYVEKEIKWALEAIENRRKIKGLNSGVKS